MIGAFIAGALFVIFVYHAYTVYQVRTITINNANQIQAIINVLNGAAAGQSAATPVVTPAADTAEE